MPPSQPEHIAISKSKGIRIDWKDGHHSAYALQYLRDRCPCAACAEGRKQSASLFQMYQATLKMEAVEPVGNYAVRIQWNDGHGTGIYSFEHFRRICPCPECQASAAQIRDSSGM